MAGDEISDQRGESYPVPNGAGHSASHHQLFWYRRNSRYPERLIAFVKSANNRFLRESYRKEDFQSAWFFQRQTFVRVSAFMNVSFFPTHSMKILVPFPWVWSIIHAFVFTSLISQKFCWLIPELQKLFLFENLYFRLQECFLYQYLLKT